jgi:ABC-type branched-subunit amino acid transport system ATPase component
MALLEAENCSLSFGGLKAVSRFSFALDRGELVGLIGPNGAGKTTVFNLVTGIYTPDEGDIRFDRQRIAGLPPFHICRRGIARTFPASASSQPDRVRERRHRLSPTRPASPRRHDPTQPRNGRKTPAWSGVPGVLRMVGLEHEARQLARSLLRLAAPSEIARALATRRRSSC